MALYMDKRQCVQNARATLSATRRTSHFYRRRGSGEWGPALARSYQCMTREEVDVRVRGEVRIRKYMKRDLHANPKRLKRADKRNRSQSAAPMIFRFSIESLMWALIENKWRRVEPWRRARRLQTRPCTYERATEINVSV